MYFYLKSFIGLKHTGFFLYQIVLMFQRQVFRFLQDFLVSRRNGFLYDFFEFVFFAILALKIKFRMQLITSICYGEPGVNLNSN